MSLLDRLSKDKIPVGNILVIDLENSVMNKFTDDRVSEVYIFGCRKIKHEELYELIGSRKPYDINNIELLDSFLDEPIFFRTVKELIEYLDSLSIEGNTIVYAHNLDYELDYILKETLGSTIEYKKGNDITKSGYTAILRSNHAPISIILDKLPTVEFRCSYALTGYSISTLAKMQGDEKLKYDYEKIRRATDKLEELDYKYNDKDIVVSGRAIIQKALMRKEKIEKLPLTTTSEMNADKENFIIKHYGKGFFENLIKKRKSQLDTTDYDFYNMVMKTRQGGLTNLNMECFNKPMQNTNSIDITSSYPYVMCNFKFPRYNKESLIFKGNTKNQIIKSTEFFEQFLLNGEKNRNNLIKGFFAWITLENVKAKCINDEIVPLLPISVNKCYNDEKYGNKNVTSINGKLINAERIDIRLNDIDYEQILLCYDFDFKICSELYVSIKNEYLSSGEISFLFSLFTEKQKLKQYKDIKTAEYNHVKAQINANYGRKQMEIIRPIYFLENGSINEVSTDDILGKVNAEQYLQEINSNSVSIDIPSDGCYISSVAKLRLIKMSLLLLEKNKEMNDKYNTDYKLNIIYSDTDSLKFNIEEKEIKKVEEDSHTFSTQGMILDINYYNNNILQFIKENNTEIINKNKENYRLHDYLNKFNLNINDKNIKEILQLGTWEIENNEDKIPGSFLTSDYFKSLGAKKYATIERSYNKKNDSVERKIKTTISGCDKAVGGKIQKYCDDNNLDYIETLNLIFNLNSVFDKSISGRTVAYDEKRSKLELSEITVDGKPIIGSGGKMIEPTSYTLGVTDNDFIYLFDTSNIEEYNRKKEDIINYGRVFLETESGKLVLLESEESIRKYFIHSEYIPKKFIYKDINSKGELILNE